MGLSSKHFSERELACKCCGENKVVQKLLDKLEKLRLMIGKPIIVNCAYRCKKHNAEVGGVANSQHLLGTAADIRVVGIKPKELAAWAEKAGFDGIGTYGTFVHVDVRGTRARWNG